LIDLPTSWSATIFAHNVARTIVACLDSVLSQLPGSGGRVFVLVNGSRDDTEKLVSRYADAHPDVTLVNLPLADKASAWNHYVHALSPRVGFHFFVDADVCVSKDAFVAMLDTFGNAPGANAVGALPLSGRDRRGWSGRMLTHGRLAGGLYALRGSFLDELRQRAVRLPAGLIGDDLLVSCLVKGALGPQGLLQPSERLVFAPAAGFSFTPLSIRRPRDWLVYGRRLVRYRIRDYQLAMLLRGANVQPRSGGLPADVATLYREAVDLPQYYWRGRITPFDLLAVWKIRNAARKDRAT